MNLREFSLESIIMEVLPIISTSKHIIKAQAIPQRQIDFTNNHPNENVIRFENIIKTLWPIPLII
jgi:hypothetical protein